MSDHADPIPRRIVVYELLRGAVVRFARPLGTLALILAGVLLAIAMGSFIAVNLYRTRADIHAAGTWLWTALTSGLLGAILEVVYYFIAFLAWVWVLAVLALTLREKYRAARERLRERESDE